MNKTEIKNYAIEARRKTIDAVRRKAAILNKDITPEKIEEVACTWFNRLIALRIMEVNDWLPTGVRILSSGEPGRDEPQALREIERLEFVDLDLVDKLRASSDLNATERLYRHVLTQQCIQLASILPGLFKSHDPETYELLPDSLLTKDGIVYDLVHKIDEANFDLDQQGQIEIIGWLYQFYISEKKDEVFAGLKKNIKINKDTIPAATQLFTPEWIVKYMVENSLGRLWLERKPNESLKANWKYYVEEAEQEPVVAQQLATLRSETPINNPTDIKFIDPCMGSGHILVYAFEVMYQIYVSEGYAERDIPGLILENNLHGLDIDDRACQLAYFALMMKARSKNRRFFRPRDGESILQPQVYSAKGDSELEEYGSLIKVDELGEMPTEVVGLTDGNYMSIEDRQNSWHFRNLLHQKYDVVVTNPPYMGGKGQGAKTAEFLKANYPDTKSDTFSAFIEQCLYFLKPSGYTGMFTPYVWMFIQSYEKLRNNIYAKHDIKSLIQYEYSAFEEATVPVCSFVLSKRHIGEKGMYFRLVDFRGGMEVQRKKFLEAIVDTNCSYFYQATTDNFSKIPGSPVAYWASDVVLNIFDKSKVISDVSSIKAGMKTGDNNRFLRLWHEISLTKFKQDSLAAQDIMNSGMKWFPYNKGGYFRKWYGNHEFVINMENGGAEIVSQGKEGDYRLRDSSNYFKQTLSWSFVSSGNFGARYYPTGFLCDVAGSSIYPDEHNWRYLLGILTSKVTDKFLEVQNPTLNFQVENISNIPIVTDESILNEIEQSVDGCVNFSRTDWDSFETSWDFKRHPLIPRNPVGANIAHTDTNCAEEVSND